MKRTILQHSVSWSLQRFQGLFSNLSDKRYLELKYWALIGKRLDLDNPRTFNEKLQWLKLYDRNQKYTAMVDKAEAKNYVAGIIGEEFIVPTLGTWSCFEDIDFSKLPERFVLKCTHDSGGVVVCSNRDEFDLDKAKKKMHNALRTNYYLSSREYPYKNITPRIIAEEYLADESGKELKDYKLMCFNGEVKCSFVCSERYSGDGLKVTFFDREWNRMPFERHYPVSSKEIKKPAHYEKMIELAETLSKDIPFVRVDFYEANGQLFFGELTFYPGSGFEEFTPEEWDYRLGEFISLPRDPTMTRYGVRKR